MSKGEHTFTADVRLLAGSGTLTVRDAVSGEILAEKALETGDSFAKVSLTFTLTSGRTAYLGVTHTGSAEQAVYIDNASVTNPEFVRMKYFTEAFDDAETLQLINKGFSVTDEAGNSGNQIAEVGGGRTGIMMLTTEKSIRNSICITGCALTAQVPRSMPISVCPSGAQTPETSTIYTIIPCIIS